MKSVQLLQQQSMVERTPFGTCGPWFKSRSLVFIEISTDRHMKEFRYEGENSE